MNNIENILKKFDVEETITCLELENNFTYTKFNDARSAAFYAYGQSKITNKHVALIVDGYYLSNIYTVLTEAWFQKTNILVIALYNSIYDVETNYLNRCLVTNIKFFDKDYEKFINKIDQSINKIGPKLINIIDEKNINYRKNNYQAIINELKNVLDEKDTLITYNSETISNVDFGYENIDVCHKYGVLSKYCAKTIHNHKIYLLCDESVINVDLNILNNRYLTSNLKIIILVKQNLNIEKWCECNNIKFINSSNLSEDIKEWYNNEKATILAIKEED